MFVKSSWHIILAAVVSLGKWTDKIKYVPSTYLLNLANL